MCEVGTTFNVWRLFKFTLKCKQAPTWESLNLCCGSSTQVCNFHYRLAENLPKDARIRCTECGAEHIEVIWNSLSLF